MTVTQTLLAIGIGYVVVTLLLMVLLLRSLWAWWVKALAIVLTCGFSIFAFYAGLELLGRRRKQVHRLRRLLGPSHRRPCQR